MKIINSLVVLVFLSVYLQGCTALLWEKRNSNGGFLAGSDDIVSTSEYSKKVGQDQLQGFVLLSEKKSSTKKIIVIGKEFGYVIHSGHADVLALLESQLDPQYWRISPSEKCECILKIHLDEVPKKQKALSFKTKITFVYSKPNLTADEQKILSQLGVSSSADKPFTPNKNVELLGDVVGLNGELKNLELKGFSQPYSLFLYADSTKKNVNYKRMLGYIALTPFTLIGDIILSPIYLIMYFEN